mmetsp:Transcript_4839/g.9945  ORF Transcript_4839/g.9945 Transcript_4839/m.9945 type:complete len:996 (+) Transcript_4839:50-3037(+)
MNDRGDSTGEMLVESKREEDGNNRGVLESLRYYDELLKQNDGDDSIYNITTNHRNGGSALHLLTESNNHDAHQPEANVMGICHIAALLDFTHGQEMIPYEPAYEVAAAVALAAHQLNVGDGSIVQEISAIQASCPIKFTVEFDNTQFVEGAALRSVIQTTSRQQRQPCAFLGAVRSAVSVPTSIVTGLQGYPQMSGHSTSADLDDKNQYPLFGRTIPSDIGNAIPVIAYFSEKLKIQHLAVLHVNDEYGNYFAEGLRLAAKRNAPHMQLTTIDIPPPQEVNYESIRDAILKVKSTGYTYIFSVMFEIPLFDAVMEEAYHQEVAGTGRHNWFFSDSFNSALLNRKFPRNSPLHLAYRGVGLMEASGGMHGEKIYEAFSRELSRLKNPVDLAYLEGMLPPVVQHNGTLDEGSPYTTPYIHEPDFLMPLKSAYISFVYEATVAIGLAACRTAQELQRQNKTLAEFDGVSLFEQIRLGTNFTSMTGQVILDPSTGTRTSSSTLFKLSNHIESTRTNHSNDDYNYIEFSSVVTDVFKGDHWHGQVPYTFNDGTSVVQRDLPLPDTYQVYASRAVHTSSLAMFVIVVLMAVGFATWTERYKKTRVVRASQPIFLHMICFGVAILASSIIPYTFDNRMVSFDGCNIACNSVFWLLSLGFSVVFAALYTKTYRVALIVQQSAHFRRVRVTVKDVVKPMVCHLGANFLVLSLMTTLNPRQWEIRVVSRDSYGRDLETYGKCSDDGILPYAIVLLSLNFGAIVFAIYQAWRARNISTEYSESAYIFIVFNSILLVGFVGGPVLALAYDNPSASMFVGSAIIFVACCSTLLWIFVPKISHQRQKFQCRSNAFASGQGFASRDLSNENHPFGLLFGEFAQFPTSAEVVAAHTDERDHGDLFDYGSLVASRESVHELEEANRELRKLLRRFEQAEHGQRIGNPTSSGRGDLDIASGGSDSRLDNSNFVSTGSESTTETNASTGDELVQNEGEKCQGCFNENVENLSKV